MKIFSIAIPPLLLFAALSLPAASAQVNEAQAQLRAAEQAVAEAKANAAIAAAEAQGAAPVTREQLQRFVVNGALAAPAAAVTDIKFRDFVKMPVGPRGIEPTDKIVALVGQRVRLLGYMARQTPPTPGMLVLSPLPVDLGDEDESLSDDLPVTATFVHLVGAQQNTPIRHVPGLLQFTGVLEIGAAEEADGHVSSFRLRLDEQDSNVIAAISRATLTSAAR
jgi:hypothetical protein